MTGMNPVAVAASDEVETRVFVLAPRDADVGIEGREIRFEVSAEDDASAQVVRPARFLGKGATG